MRELRTTDAFDVAVIVPTVADPDVLVPTYQSLVSHADGLRVLYLLVVNPVSNEAADEAVRHCLHFQLPARCLHRILRFDGPLGFGPALNRGLMRLEQTYGLPPAVVFHNDDCHVSDGWLLGLGRALEPTGVRLWGEMRRRPRSAPAYGRIGIVGPLAEAVAGTQLWEVPQEDQRGPFEAYAAKLRREQESQVFSSDFVSGMCMLVRRECLAELALWHAQPEEVRHAAAREVDGSGGEWWWISRPPPDDQWPADFAGLFDERFLPAGYEDNDLCARAHRAGWRMAVAAEVFVDHAGHRTFDKHFPEAHRGLGTRHLLYRKWAPTTKSAPLVVAAYRVRLEVPHDLEEWRASLARTCALVDGVAVLLTGNPLDVTTSEEWTGDGSVPPAEDRMLKACSGGGPEHVASAVKRWAEDVAAHAPDSRRPKVVAATWTGAACERDERNALLTGAEALLVELAVDRDTDNDEGWTPPNGWILSVDHDEVPEDRLTRAHLERLCRHPDPGLMAWDVGWLNHWDSPRVVRQDRPWGDGGTYEGGMHGARLYRLACTRYPKRILAGTDSGGLHCGNVPDFDAEAKRVAGFRFRHLGYLRPQDRARKFARYARQDPDPDPTLTGDLTGYGHLLHEEGMRTSAYLRDDGVGLHVLLHEGESQVDLGRWLDELYGMVDDIVLVWTGRWDEEDQDWLRDAPLHDSERGLTRLCPPEGAGEWPATGPGREVAELAHLFGCRWVHHPLADDLSGARNAGLDALRDVPGLGWALFVDPDEWLPHKFVESLALRAMAEVSDSWGWMFRVCNHHADARPPSYSESVRMSRLDPQRLMRFNGRVHEGFDRGLQRVRELGYHPWLRYAPFTLQHGGLAKDAARMDNKLRWYERLLLLELADDPLNTKAWASLATHCANRGRHDLAAECLRRGIAVGDDAYLPYKELALQHVRIAGGLMRRAMDRAAPTHPFYKAGKEMAAILEKLGPPPPRFGDLARMPDAPALPEFPRPPYDEWELAAGTDPDGAFERPGGVIAGPAAPAPPGASEPIEVSSAEDGRRR